MTTLIDNFGGTLPIFVLGIIELVAIFYFYGLQNICIDVQFMSGRNVSFYWRICWFLLAPAIMMIVLIYSTVTMESLTYAGQPFPRPYIVAGWSLFFVAMLQIPLWFAWDFYQKAKIYDLSTAFCATFKCTQVWGPRAVNNKTEWHKYREEMKERARCKANANNHSKLRRKIATALGFE